MVEIPKLLPTPPPSAIASYPFVEIASGLGFVSYFGFDSINDATKDYHISEASIFSNEIETKATVDSGDTSFTKVLDLDFDTSTFKLPRTVSGTAGVTVAWGANDSFGQSAAGEWYVIAKIVHVDASGETILGTAQTATLTGSGSAFKKSVIGTLQIPLITKLFKEGDTLKIRMEGWGRTTNTTIHSMYIAHDPKARDGEIINTTSGADSTIMEIKVPFKIDL